MSDMLEIHQLESFNKTGFVVAKGLFNREEAELIAKWTDEIASLPELPGRYMMYFEHSLVDRRERILSRIENFHPYHQGFHDLIMDWRVQGWVSQLFTEPAILFKDKINFKMPGADGFKPHQDVQAGWDRYARLHITALLSIDASTPENGCLEIAPGHHQQGQIGTMWQPLSDQDLQGIEFEQCLTAPGDVVFFDSYTPHRSGPNLTGAPRRVLYVTFNRASEGDHREQYYADKRKSYPPDCERESDKHYAFRV